MLRRIYAALMIVLTMFGGTYSPQQTAPAPSDTSNETVKTPFVQTSDTPSEPVTKEMTKDDAVTIALEHAGLKASEVKRLKVEKDYEKGVAVFEIEFEKGAWEYEYEIRISDGKILEWDKEIDD